MAQKKKVLVVDDQKINRDILTNMLEEEYDVVCAENGRTAIEILLGETEISAVLLDLVMPEMDGYAVLSEMKRHPEISKIPVIVATQMDATDIEVKALTMGARDFVTKPYRPQVICQRLRNLIQMKEAKSTVKIIERDSLTGLLNKEAFFHKVSKELKEKVTEEFDIVIIDIEKFKLVNENYGVEEGDHLIRHMAEVLDDVAQRIGGFCAHASADMFYIFAPRTDDYLNTIIEYVDEDVAKYPLNMRLNVKYGIYQIENRETALLNMCDRARMAVNKVKGDYDRKYSYYDESFHDGMLEQQSIIDDMEKALEGEEFVVYLQPQVELKNETVHGAEALVRWQHPTRGMLSPADFVPLFEDNGFVTHMDMFVWEKTCQMIREWKDKGYRIVPVSVNISRKDFYKLDLAEHMKALVMKYKLNPFDLHLEVTESAYTENSKQIIHTLNKLRKMGFLIEMDDFGSGYSSLNMIYELPINVLKLDMKFMQANNQDLEKVMKFVIGLAKSLNLSTTAEGVETKEQVELLKRMGCDTVQGFFYSKPIPESDFIKLINK